MSSKHTFEEKIIDLLNSFYEQQKAIHAQKSCTEETLDPNQIHDELHRFLHDLFCPRCEEKRVDDRIALSRAILQDWSPESSINEILTEYNRTLKLNSIQDLLDKFRNLPRFLEESITAGQAFDQDFALNRSVITTLSVEIINMTKNRLQQKKLEIIIQKDRLQVSGFSPKFNGHKAYLTLFSKTALIKLFPDLKLKNPIRFITKKLLNEKLDLLPSYSMYSQQTMIIDKQTGLCAEWNVTPELLGAFRNPHILNTIIIFPSLIYK